MSYFPSWCVAAAILVIEDAAFHYKVLAKRVRKTGEAGLGVKGGKTTWETLGARMREHPEVILCYGDGVYGSMGDEAAMANLQVRACIWILMREKLQRYGELLRQIVNVASPTPAEVEEFDKLKALVDRIVPLFQQYHADKAANAVGAA